jgi:hypothetical protein
MKYDFEDEYIFPVKMMNPQQTFQTLRVVVNVEKMF